MQNTHRPYGPYERYFKRPLDIVCAGVLLILLSPLFLITMLLIRLKIGKPVFFTQQRVGLNDTVFNILKFRTMLVPQTRDGKLLTDAERLECIKKGIAILTDEERLTKLGKFLRATSIDELPELWNILKGEMSFIGPRPLPPLYLPYYTEIEKERHWVRPGLTGLAQIHGRNELSWDKKFAYDVQYVGHITLWNDFMIFLQTIAIVVKREGIGQGNARPEAFHIVRQREWKASKSIK